MTSRYTRMVRAGLLTAMALVGVGCSGNSDDPSDSGSGTGGSGATGSGGSSSGSGGATGGSGGSTSSPYTGTCVTDGQLVITDDTNYQLRSELKIVSQTIKDGTDLTFDWSGVTKDFYGRTVDPVKDIDVVLVSLWSLTEQGLTDTINQDKLRPRNAKGALTAYPEDNFTSVKLLEMNSFKNEVPIEEVEARFVTTRPDYQYPSATNTFMMSAATGTDPQRNSRMVGFFKLDPASTNTTVTLTSDSAKMELEVHVANIKQLLVPASRADLSIDWGQMTTNAVGNPYDGSQIDTAVVAHYSSLTLSDLEAQFLELESLADGWWTGEVTEGTKIGLSTLKDESDAAFSGIDATGVWLVALFCTKNCNNPAPWSITVLRPCG